ncbi:MAG: AAA family ATPase [Clostridium sp.]|uniref:AAA family ATPase n=1 Tax=Clostridium sp. TaxID=1506 RepID=UPI003F3F929F
MIIRLQEVNIKNFKNVEEGKITFESYRKKEYFNEMFNADIVGIYGQNGSGKTSMVESVEILKNVLLGKSLDVEIKELIDINDETVFGYKFLIVIDEERYMVNYKFIFRWIEEEENLKIVEEELDYAKIDITSEKIENKKEIIKMKIEDKNEKIFLPVKNLKLIKKEKELDLMVAKKIAETQGQSFIFNKKTIEILKECFIDENEVLMKIINSLVYFGVGVFIIKNDELAQIDINAFMPFNFKLSNKKNATGGTLAIKLFEPSVVHKEIFDLLKNILSQINIVLKSLIPGMEIEVKVLREELLKSGDLGVAIQLISIRNEKEIPLKYESEGIKKIIAILSALIEMYNNENGCIIVDELDSGVFEFLLGEILEVLKEKGKGQLIFTSHNLRALEVLDKNDIVFTTTNPKKRYIKLKGVKNTNNLRDFYLREIFLGGQEEEIYKKTKSYAISRAFRKAGEFNE